ncbi:MAG: hypothetical protein M3R37_00105 [Actinomycetota bacterium]|nr:hypothetical protein [Actinomycetota bacterium]
MVGAGAGALAFGLFDNWTGFILCAVATLLAIVQLVRILLRKPGKPGDGLGGGRRW